MGPTDYSYGAMTTPKGRRVKFGERSGSCSGLKNNPQFSKPTQPIQEFILLSIWSLSSVCLFVCLCVSKIRHYCTDLNLLSQ